MNGTNSWWKDIFSGDLSVGINDSKTYQLVDESFLYYVDSSIHLSDSEEEERFE